MRLPTLDRASVLSEPVEEVLRAAMAARRVRRRVIPVLPRRRNIRPSEGLLTVDARVHGHLRRAVTSVVASLATVPTSACVRRHRACTPVMSRLPTVTAASGPRHLRPPLSWREYRARLANPRRTTRIFVGSKPPVGFESGAARRGGPISWTRARVARGDRRRNGNPRAGPRFERWIWLSTTPRTSGLPPPQEPKSPRQFANPLSGGPLRLPGHG